MNKIAALALAVSALVSCAGPQPSRLVGANELPANWLTLAPSSWQVRMLDRSTQDLLESTRKQMAAERETPAFKFYGKYSEKTQAMMDEANRTADVSYLASSGVLQRNLTTELYSTAETRDSSTWDWYEVTNQDLRMVGDDWARLWLVDRPSYLSPYPIVNTTGNP